MAIGLNVRIHVEVEHELELGPVQTRNLNTVEITVLEMLYRLRTATQNHVQVR